MSEPKFTPGPWGVPEYTGDGKRLIIEQHGDGWQRLSVEVDSDDCDRSMAEANAYLIAAAPDLFAALKAIVNSDMAMREEDEGRESPELNAARAAIAQAEGGAK